MALSAMQNNSRLRIPDLALTIGTFGIAAMVAIVAYGWIEGSTAPLSARPYWDMWSIAAVTCLGGWILLCFSLPVAEERKFLLALSGLSVFMVVLVALALKGTPYTLDAIEADQRFYTAFVTKLATQWGYGDVVYQGLPAFYPPLYFWLLARLAGLTAIEPYMTMKIGVLVTAFLMPYGAAWMWGRTVAVPFAVAPAFVMLFYQEWFKTAEWLSLVLFVPWWIAWVENGAGRSFSTRGKKWLWWALGGLVGSLIFQTYYYWFFIGGISLIIQWVWDRAKPRGTHSLELTNAIAVLVSTALFSIVYWGPYLVSMAQTGGWQPLQNRWLSEGKIPLPFPFLDGSVEGGFLLAGLFYLLLTAGRSRVSRGMIALVAAVYVWSGLGIVGMMTDRPLLTFRAYTVVEQVLAIGAVMGLMHLWQRKPRAGEHLSGSEKSIVERIQTIAPAIALLLVLYFSQESALRFLQDVMVSTAREATYPRELVDTFESLTASAYEDKVFLLGYGYRDLLAYRPVYTFLPWSAHFSHPAGLYRERVTFLEELAATTDPDLFAAALLNNRYSRIDHLMLEREDTTWQLRFADDDFPNRSVERAFSFDEELFAPPYFEVKETNGMTLITPNFEADPLATIDLNALDTAPVDTVALLYTLVSTFGSHVDLPDYEETHDEAERVLLGADLSTLSPETLLSLQLAAGGELHDKTSAALEATLPNFVDVNLVDEDGVERVRVIGFALQPQSVGDSDLELAIYMEAINPMDIDYTMWVHADREGTQLNLDHTLNAPTSTWDVGKIYRDTYVITAEPGDYHFTFGLWRSEGELRLRRTDGAIDVDLGTLTIP